MIGRDFAHSLFDQQTVQISREVLRNLAQDAALLSLTDRITTKTREQWTQGEATFDSARRLSPDTSGSLASTLRWLLAHHPETASLTCSMIAFTARERFEIPTVFTAGWLASNIDWAGLKLEPLPDNIDIDAFVQAATSNEAFQQL
ncbi:hypothetical protein ABZ747_17715 [Kitasatospora cineracea]|uniref:hypothetical protein n=1 Tax=Kitasatospora cineracea TaxID=88074 RepID=UPI003401846B